MSHCASCLLIPRFIGRTGPLRRQRTTHTLSQHLGSRFGFSLTLCATRSRSKGPPQAKIDGPAALKSDILQLVGTVITGQKSFDCQGLTQLFVRRAGSADCTGFGTVLPGCLLCAIDNGPISRGVGRGLEKQLTALCSRFSRSPISDSLVLHADGQIVSCLVARSRTTPSTLFDLILSRNGTLALTVVLLGLILVSRGSRLCLRIEVTSLVHCCRRFPHDRYR